MKTTIKIYLEPEDLKLLKQKVEEAGFTGRGSISAFISKIAKEDLIFLDNNIKKLKNVFRMEVKPK